MRTANAVSREHAEGGPTRGAGRNATTRTISATARAMSHRRAGRRADQGGPAPGFATPQL